MTTTELQRELFETINSIQDKRILEELKVFVFDKINMQLQENKDTWDDLPDDLKFEIKQGLSDIETGNVIEHEEVMQKYKQWL